MARRVYPHYAVLVEQLPITLDKDREVTAVLEGQPCASVRKHIGIGRRGCVESRPHALSNLLVPSTASLSEVEPGVLPKSKLGDVGARPITARDERSVL